MMSKNKQEDGHLINMRDSWQVLLNTIYIAIVTYGKDWKKV